MKFLQYLYYVKKRGFRNYWQYLRVKKLMQEIGFSELPKNYDDFMKSIAKIYEVSTAMGIMIEIEERGK